MWRIVRVDYVHPCIRLRNRPDNSNITQAVWKQNESIARYVLYREIQYLRCKPGHYDARNLYVTIHNHLQHPAFAIYVLWSYELWLHAWCVTQALRGEPRAKRAACAQIFNTLKVMLHISSDISSDLGKQVVAYLLFRKDVSWKWESSVVLLVPRAILCFVDVSSATSGDSDASLGCWPRRDALFRDLSTAQPRLFPDHSSLW